MKKNKMIKLIVGIAMISAISEAKAVVSLSLEPALQSIGVGGPASVNLVVSGLGNFSSLSLGGFSIDLSYNPAIVSASSLAFGNFLDLGLAGSVRSSDLSSPGLIHLDEVSLENSDALNASQPASFTLATLRFLGSAPGLSPLTFTGIDLSNEQGVSILDVAINTAAIEVTGRSVPEAGRTLALLGIASAIMALLRHRPDLARPIG